MTIYVSWRYYYLCLSLSLKKKTLLGRSTVNPWTNGGLTIGGSVDVGCVTFDDIPRPLPAAELEDVVK